MVHRSVCENELYSIQFYLICSDKCRQFIELTVLVHFFNTRINHLRFAYLRTWIILSNAWSIFRQYRNTKTWSNRTMQFSCGVYSVKACKRSYKKYLNLSSATTCNISAFIYTFSVNKLVILVRLVPLFLTRHANCSKVACFCHFVELHKSSTYTYGNSRRKRLELM